MNVRTLFVAAAVAIMTVACSKTDDSKFSPQGRAPDARPAPAAPATSAQPPPMSGTITAPEVQPAQPPQPPPMQPKQPG